MRGFIELIHEHESGIVTKALLNVLWIHDVIQREDGRADLTVDYRLERKGWKDLTYTTKESYEEIVEKIRAAVEGDTWH